MAPKISVVMPTAREDYPLVGLPKTHLFQPTTESLSQQGFSDFELVVVDALHHERPAYFDQHPMPFQVVHIPPKPNPWHARKLWAVATQFNTGLAHASGDLVVTIGDCSWLPPHLLGRFWDLHREGWLAQSMIKYHRAGGPLVFDDETVAIHARARAAAGNGDPDLAEVEKTLSSLYQRGDPVVDTRFRFVKAAGGRIEAKASEWWYGYGAAPMAAYLAVNGFDEAFDGAKSLEDCDLGSRFEMAGYTKFVVASDLWAVENAHEPVSSKVIAPKSRAQKCNYAIYLWNRRAGRMRANTGPLPSEALKFIRETTMSDKCSHAGGTDYDLGEAFDRWAADIPAFDLAAERRNTLGLA